MKDTDHFPDISELKRNFQSFIKEKLELANSSGMDSKNVSQLVEDSIRSLLENTQLDVKIFDKVKIKQNGDSLEIKLSYSSKFTDILDSLNE